MGHLLSLARPPGAVASGTERAPGSAPLVNRQDFPEETSVFGG